ncbi:MAG: hypothetical protein ACJAS1_005929 [Oleiphilaceae bacterium]|jgi:hypothetical protein
MLSIPLAFISSAKEVVIGFGKNKVPFVIKEAGQSLEIDIFREALAFNGHTLSISTLITKDYCQRSYPSVWMV